MNEYRFEHISVGLQAAFDVLITADAVQAFAALSGDYNPLHTDSNFAKQRGYASEVVFGMLISSYLSRLVGMYLPGKHALLHGVDVKFLKPNYVGDLLTIRGEVTYINEAYKQLEIAATVSNQRGETVCKAKIKAGCHE